MKQAFAKLMGYGLLQWTVEGIVRRRKYENGYDNDAEDLSCTCRLR